MEQKLILTLLLVGCLVASATAQCVTEINECFTTNNFDDPDDYDGFPVLLDVPEGDRDDFCESINDFSACIDLIRTNCSDFGQWTRYAAFENMGQFMCTPDGRDAYDTYYNVINNTDYRTAWDDCADDVTALNGEETDGCSILSNSVDCHVNAITGESTQAQAYVGDFADAALEDYNTHYLCPSGSSTVGITSSLMIMTLFAFLWSSFH